MNSKQKEPKYLIIPAAGLGTRMRSVNPDLPKEMLPVGKQPAIQYAVEEGMSAGIKEIIIIISQQKQIIRKYFEEKEVAKRLFPDAVRKVDEINRHCSIVFLYQKELLGESDAISYARDNVGNHSLAIIHPDDIYFPAPGVLQALKTAYTKHNKNIIALVEVKELNSDGLSNSGRVDIELVKAPVFRILKFHEKGKGKYIKRFKGELRSCGMSITGPYIFTYIDKLRNNTSNKELTDFPVYEMILHEKGFLGYHLKGNFFDVGNPTGYSQCIEYINSISAHKI